MDTVSPRMAMTLALHNAGFIWEESERVVNILGPALPDYLRKNTDHPFYDFTRSLRILARQEQVSDKEARRIASRDPFTFLEIHDLKPNQEMLPPQDILPPEESVPGKKLRRAFDRDDQIIASVADFLKDHKRYPRKTDGRIENGPLENRATWYRVDALLSKLARNDEKREYKNLQEFIEIRCVPETGVSVEAAKPQRPRGHGKKPRFATLPEKDLLASIQAFYQKNKRRPQVLHGMIEDGPLAGKITWGGINALIMRQAQQIDNPPYTSLAEFMDAKGGFDRKYGRLPLNARNLFNALSRHITETKTLPPETGLKKLGDFKMVEIRRAFRNSALPGLEDYTRNPAKPPADLNEFLLETGLARRDGNQLLPVPSTL